MAASRSNGVTGFLRHTCGEWHDSQPLDLGFDEPMYVPTLDGDERAEGVSGDGSFRVIRSEDETNYFIRGVIEIPIIGTKDTFCYGVWTTLSEESHAAAMAADRANKIGRAHV